jgi:8-oxo-dGTP pyrophosphatase MutT (NUDIX family)
MRYLLGLIMSFFLSNSANAKLVFLEPPENYNPKIEVSACFMKSKDQVLFLKRVPKVSEGECWGIPGGKLEKQETAHAAALREVHEETGLAFPAHAVTHIRTVYIRYPHIDFTYHMFETELSEHPEVTIDPNEHTEFKWMTLNEALLHPLIPGEDECIFIAYGQNDKKV